MQAYPIHPEVFDRLYEDWTTIDGFQRTRGVLKLMAKVIYRLWKDDNKDLMILPGSLPLYDGSTRNELTYYLPAGLGPGDRAGHRRRPGRDDGAGKQGAALRRRSSAARRVARTLFLGSAPSSVATKPGIRGLDRARVLLGCLQPGQTSSRLRRCAEPTGGSTALPEQLRRQGAGRDPLLVRHPGQSAPGDGGPQEAVSTTRPKCAARWPRSLKKLVGSATFFDGVHIFTPHGDVPDDSALRLVVLPPEQFYSREEDRAWPSMPCWTTSATTAPSRGIAAIA